MPVISLVTKERCFKNFDKVIRKEGISKYIRTLQAIEEYNVELQSDLIIRRYVDSLADTVLEKDISRAIEPYSLIEVLSFLFLKFLGHSKSYSGRIIIDIIFDRITMISIIYNMLLKYFLCNFKIFNFKKLIFNPSLILKN